MRYILLMALLFISLPALAQNASTVPTITQPEAILIRNITIEGFVLGDKSQFTKLFKPYRDKHLSSADMDVILQKIRDIYEMGGYQQLVSIAYRVDKHHLIFTVTMTS